MKEFINQIICGDSFQIMKEFPDKSVDLVLTDPLYNLNIIYEKDKPKYDSVVTNKIFVRSENEKYLEWSKSWFSEAKRISDLIVFTPGRMNFGLWIEEIEQPYWVCIWVIKSAINRSLIGGLACWEPILVYGKPKKRVMPDIFDYPTFPQKSIGEHIHPKPLPLFLDLVKKFSNENDLIFDPFCGSGTTCVASKRLGRRFIGIDIKPEYCEITRERLNHISYKSNLKDMF